MQINVGPCPAGGCQPFDLAALQAALPKAYKATQPPPIVPQVVYNAAFGTANTDSYVMNTDSTVNLSGATQFVASVKAIVPGSGYTVAPTVTFVSANGLGSGAAAMSCLNGVTGVTVTAAGTGYTTYQVKAINGSASSAFSNTAYAHFGAAADFDGDGKTDISVFRAPGSWMVAPAGAGAPSYSGILGAAGDIPVPGDYDGDAMADFAVYRPSTATWIIVPSSTGVPYSVNWGLATDIPVPGDYDGDGKTDIAVWRPADGSWWILNSSNGSMTSRQWGMSTDKVVPGDYDGDGKTDIAIFRPAEGN